MVRDWDLIRRILLTCEAAPAGRRLSPSEFDVVDKVLLADHVRMLSDEGYITAKLPPSGPAAGVFMILSLNWGGHDLLAQMRSDTWWASIKKAAKDKGLELTLDVVKALAGVVLKSMVAG